MQGAPIFMSQAFYSAEARILLVAVLAGFLVCSFLKLCWRDQQVQGPPSLVNSNAATSAYQSSPAFVYGAVGQTVTSTLNSGPRGGSSKSKGSMNPSPRAWGGYMGVYQTISGTPESGPNTPTSLSHQRRLAERSSEDAGALSTSAASCGDLTSVAGNETKKKEAAVTTISYTPIGGFRSGIINVTANK